MKYIGKICQNYQIITILQNSGEPLMGYTIKDFIDSNKFPELQLISDNSGIKR